MCFSEQLQDGTELFVVSQTSEDEREDRRHQHACPLSMELLRTWTDWKKVVTENLGVCKGNQCITLLWSCHAVTFASMQTVSVNQLLVSCIDCTQVRAVNFNIRTDVLFYFFSLSHCGQTTTINKELFSMPLPLSGVAIPFCRAHILILVEATVVWIDICLTEGECSAVDLRNVWIIKVIYVCRSIWSF